jgi:hypothetical protein
MAVAISNGNDQINLSRPPTQIHNTSSHSQILSCRLFSKTQAHIPKFGSLNVQILGLVEGQGGGFICRRVIWEVNPRVANRDWRGGAQPYRCSRYRHSTICRKRDIYNAGIRSATSRDECRLQYPNARSVTLSRETSDKDATLNPSERFDIGALALAIRSLLHRPGPTLVLIRGINQIAEIVVRARMRNVFWKLGRKN